MLQSGKKFEQNFKNSVPKDIFYYRFRDSASTYYGGNSNLRFSNTNIADCLLFNGCKLILCELKAHKGSSIPLDCIIGKKSKEKQINDLHQASLFKNVNAYIICFFEDKELCYALPISKFVEFNENSDRKSVPISYFQENGIEIKTKKLKTNYMFQLDNLIEIYITKKDQ